MQLFAQEAFSSFHAPSPEGWNVLSSTLQEVPTYWHPFLHYSALYLTLCNKTYPTKKLYAELPNAAKLHSKCSKTRKAFRTKHRPLNNKPRSHKSRTNHSKHNTDQQRNSKFRTSTPRKGNLLGLNPAQPNQQRQHRGPRGRRCRAQCQGCIIRHGFQVCRATKSIFWKNDAMWQQVSDSIARTGWGPHRQNGVQRK